MEFKEMKKVHPVLFYLCTAIAIFIGLTGVYAMNAVPENPPTIPELHRIILKSSYGEAVTIINFDKTQLLLHLWIDEPLTIPSDYYCHQFTLLIWSLMQFDERLVIDVQGTWVPSSQNPITYEWAQYMLEYDIDAGYAD